MAGDSIKDLLVKFIVDPSNLDEATKKVRATLASIEEEEKARAAQSKADQAAAIASQQAQVELIQKAKEAEKEKAKLTKDILAEDKKAKDIKATWLKEQEAQQARMDAEIAARRKVELASVQVAIREKMAAEKKAADAEAAEEEKKRLEHKKAHEEEMLHIKEEAAERAKLKGLSGLLVKAGMKEPHAEAIAEGAAGGTRALLGGGMLGAVATGAMEGAIVVAAIEAIGEGIEKLIDKFKELVIESGKLTQMSDTFERLSKSKGITDTTAFMEELRASTHNLVSDMDLLRTANTFLQSNMKMSKEDMIKLTEATVNLARANGKDVPAAMAALNRFYLTGRAMSLSMVTGIQRQELAVKGLGAALSDAEKRQANFEHALKVIEARSEFVGPTAITFQEAIKGLENVRGRLLEAFGQGITKSAGFQEFTKFLTETAEKIGGMEGLFQRVGNSVGNTLGAVTSIVKSAIPVFEQLGHVLKSLIDVIGDVAGAITDKLLKSFGLLADKASDRDDGVVGQFKKMHPMIASLTIGYMRFSEAIQLVLFGINGLTQAIKTFLEHGKNLDIGNMAKTLLSMPGTEDKGGYLQSALDEYDQMKAKGNLKDSDITSFKRKIKNFEADNAIHEERDLANPFAMFQYSRRRLQENAQREIEETAKAFTAPAEKPGAVGEREGVGNEEDERNKRKIEAANLKEKRAALAEEMAITKEGLEHVREMYDDSYKSGTMDAQKYFENRRNLVIADYNMAEDNAKKQHKLTVDDISARLARHDILQAVATKEIQTADDVMNKALSVAATAESKGLYGVEKESRQETSQVALARINAELAAKKNAIQEETAITEHNFKQNAILGDQYLKERISQINAEVEAQKWASEQILTTKKANYTFTPKDEEDQRKAIQDSVDAAAKQARDLNLNVPETLLQGAQGGYQNVLGDLQSRLGMAQMGATGISTAGATPLAIQQQMKAATLSQIDLLQSILPYADQGTAAWYHISDAILKAQQAVIGFNEEIKKTSFAVQESMGAILGSLGQELSGIFGSHFAQGLERAFSGVGKQLQGAASLNQVLGDTGGEKGAAEGYGTFGADISTIKGGVFGSGYESGDVSAAFGDLTKKTTALIGAFGNFINTVEHSGSALAGAFSGTVGGASLGGSIGAAAGQAFGKKDAAGNLTGMGAMAGPMGAAIGASLGLMYGMISGQKQEMVEHAISDLNVSFKKMMDSMSTGNSSIQMTIENLKGLIQDAQFQMSMSKKGSGEFKKLILQYQEQITQLENQAVQTIYKLKEQLDVLGSPTAYQGIVGNIQQIIEQYTQFLGAAKQGTDEWNKANEFLTGSLQQLATGYSQQLLQNEQTSVQNAINLNELMNQRNQLQYQFLQQTQQIVGAGTITRQQTVGQSKYSQLYQASISYSNQMMQINSQIAIAQAQVTAAQQVFDLATTRQGLENQMVALQTQSINLDMARIAAMKDVLDKLESTGYSIAGAGTAYGAADPNQYILQLLGAFLTSLGISPQGSVSSFLPKNTNANKGPLGSVSAQAYQSMARLGMGGFNGVNLG